MGNAEILKRGGLQRISGTGISQSEKAHGSKKLQPMYFTHNFADKEKADKWARVVAPVEAKGVLPDREREGPAPVQSPLTLYATLLSGGKSLDQRLEGKKGYIHVFQTSGYNAGKGQGSTVRVSSKGGEELVLREGDDAYVFVGNSGNVLQVENAGDHVNSFYEFSAQ